MSTHNIGFYEDLIKIIFELSSNIIKYAPYFFCCCTATEDGLTFCIQKVEGLYYLQYSLELFSPARSPPRRMFPSHLKFHSPVCRGIAAKLRRISDGILSYLYMRMEQVSTGNRFLPASSPRTTQDPLTWEFLLQGAKL